MVRVHCEPLAPEARELGLRPGTMLRLQLPPDVLHVIPGDD